MSMTFGILSITVLITCWYPRVKASARLCMCIFLVYVLLMGSSISGLHGGKIANMLLF